MNYSIKMFKIFLQIYIERNMINLSYNFDINSNMNHKYLKYHFQIMSMDNLYNSILYKDKFGFHLKLLNIEHNFELNHKMHNIKNIESKTPELILFQ